MNELVVNGEKKMTVKEIAKAFNCDESTIQKRIRILFPESIQNGKATLLDERQVTILKLEIQGNAHLGRASELPKTMLEKQLLIKQAAMLQDEIIEQLTKERDEANRRNAILMHVAKTYTITEIAKELGMRSAQELNEALVAKGVQYKQNGTWVPKADYSELGYFEIKQFVLDNGRVIYNTRLTQDGRAFVLILFDKQ